MRITGCGESAAQTQVHAGPGGERLLLRSMAGFDFLRLTAAFTRFLLGEEGFRRMNLWRARGRGCFTGKRSRRTVRNTSNRRTEPGSRAEQDLD